MSEEKYITLHSTTSTCKLLNSEMLNSDISLRHLHSHSNIIDLLLYVFNTVEQRQYNLADFKKQLNYTANCMVIELQIFWKIIR